jgi:hypothetical protein
MKKLTQVLDFLVVLDFEALTYFGHPVQLCMDFI